MKTTNDFNGVRVFRRFDYLRVTIFSLATAALWGSLHSIILPLRLLDFVSESQKNTSLGLLTLTGLLLAMAAQPVAGALSDRSAFSWGRRRPFILAGTIATVLLLPLIGFAGSYVAIFTIYCLLQISANAAQGPYQAFIPDLVPENHRGMASGVKSLLEIIGGLILVWAIFYSVNHFLAATGSLWLWLVLVILAALLLATMLVTVITVKERPITSGSQALPTKTVSRSFIIDAIKNRNFVLFLVSRLLFIMALTTLQSFSFYFVQDMAGVADPTIATAQLLAAVGMGMVITVYPAGRLSDRLGRKPVVISSGILGTLGILVLFFAPSYGYILVGGTLEGIAGGVFMSSNWALATDLVLKGEEAKYLGLSNMATAGGAALARLIGPVIDYFNSYGPGMGYQVMLLTCFIYFIAGSILTMKIKVRLGEIRQYDVPPQGSE